MLFYVCISLFTRDIPTIIKFIHKSEYFIKIIDSIKNSYFF